MQKKYFIAGLASGFVPAGLVFGQDSPVPTGPHFDGNVPTEPDTVLIVGTGFDPNGTLDPYVVVGQAPWTNVSGWVYTPDYQNIDDTQGFLYDCTDNTDVPVWWYDGVDLDLPWYFEDPCRSYTDQCA
jgi:hypothetical protein